MNICLANWANISTIVLAVAAIAAAIFAVWNIKVLREQNRRNTFLGLMADITATKAREDRAILHKIYKRAKEIKIAHRRVVDFFIAKGEGPYLWKQDDLNTGELMGISRAIQKPMGLTDGEVNKRFREAFEDTIALFDRLGFFLLRGDSLLRKEAPLWIWDMTNDMWEYLGDYIKNRQKHSGDKEKNYAKYFGELTSIAKKHI